ncbi:MAG: LemA family protein [Spirochaetaceae bacterium]|nr:LemA family protein [Spirochaetaceae bacterium]
MNKGLKGLIVAIGIILVLIVAGCSFYTGNYNKMVTLDEQVSNKWAQVQNQYQRRYDLIPNLVETVKGYASHESQVFTDIAEARSKVGGITQLSAADLSDPVKVQQFQAAQASLGGALQRLLSITENYPELQANSNFLALQDELEGTENRITIARQDYNDAVTNFNTTIRRFPQNIIAGISGFTSKANFSADAAAQSAPSVSFD